MHNISLMSVDLCILKLAFFVVIIILQLLYQSIFTDLVVDCLLAKGLQVCYIYVLNIIL